jgi:hypothetical protein
MKITKDQSRDTGMAMVLLLLILFLSLKQQPLVLAALALHVVNMTAPQLFKPVALVWLSLSHLLGSVVSRMLLALVFFVVVTPMGAVRRLLGKDSLRLRVFKSSTESVMVHRNHIFVSDDLERPY